MFHAFLGFLDQSQHRPFRNTFPKVTNKGLCAAASTVLAFRGSLRQVARDMGYLFWTWQYGVRKMAHGSN